MTSNQSENIVIRAKNFKNLPEIENSIHFLQKKGTLKALAHEKNLTIKELKKFPVGRLFDIFKMGDFELEVGDIVIFYSSGNYQFFTPTPYDLFKK